MEQSKQKTNAGIIGALNSIDLILTGICFYCVGSFFTSRFVRWIFVASMMYVSTRFFALMNPSPTGLDLVTAMNYAKLFLYPMLTLIYVGFAAISRFSISAAVFVLFWQAL